MANNGGTISGLGRQVFRRQQLTVQDFFFFFLSLASLLLRLESLERLLF
jgi:hypothetical protein